MIYTIEADNHITMFASAKEAKAAQSGDFEQFGSAKELAKLASHWPAHRLAEVWNSLPGVKPVKKFKDRATGANRVWQTLHKPQLDVTSHDQADLAPKPPVVDKKFKAGKQATAGQQAPTRPARTKTAQILELIHRPQGASLAAIMEATGWQAHSVRGFVSGTLGKKMGLKIESVKGEDGYRVYTLAT